MNRADTTPLPASDSPIPNWRMMEQCHRIRALRAAPWAFAFAAFNFGINTIASAYESVFDTDSAANMAYIITFIAGNVLLTVFAARSCIGKHIRRRARNALGLATCMACGYEMHTIPTTTCPECGKTLQTSTKPAPDPAQLSK